MAFEAQRIRQLMDNANEGVEKSTVELSDKIVSSAEKIRGKDRKVGLEEIYEEIDHDMDKLKEHVNWWLGLLGVIGALDIGAVALAGDSELIEKVGAYGAGALIAIKAASMAYVAVSSALQKRQAKNEYGQ